MIDLASVPVSPRMRRVLEHAAAIGEQHTRTAFLGTENVLRALAEDIGGIAGQVLEELGVRDRELVRLDEIMTSAEYRAPSAR